MKSIAIYDRKSGRFMEGAPLEGGFFADLKWFFGPVRFIDGLVTEKHGDRPASRIAILKAKLNLDARR